jgi:hypothetical protein
MSNGGEFTKPCVYQIKVKGNLPSEWSEWFDGLLIAPQPDNETLLSGQIEDQTALHGLLARIGSLGIPLLSVTRVEFQEGKTDKHEGNMEE